MVYGRGKYADTSAASDPGDPNAGRLVASSVRKYGKKSGCIEARDKHA